MYDFEGLSPIDFEELVRDLVQKELCVSLESFSPGRDQGIDFRHATSTDTLIVQAKHFLRSGKRKLINALKQENAKVARLKPSRYLVATSVSLTAADKQKIIDAMPDAPLTSGDIWGKEELNARLDANEAILRQHFKLWLASGAVLDRILHSGVYNRSETELAVISEIVPKFVQNESVNDAQALLEREGSLIIAGEPGVGKSTLARILVWLHAAQGWKISVVDDLTAAFQVANPNEKHLIFFDDFLGQVQLTPDHVRGIDRQLPAFLDRVRLNKNLRFILTTREYILSQAEALSQRIRTAADPNRRYVLKVGLYTRELRARILYNHLLFSDLPKEMIREILADDFYLKIIDHQNFNPRLIEALTSKSFTAKTDQVLPVLAIEVLDNPEMLWDQPYREHISLDGRALMVGLLLRTRNVPINDLQTLFVLISKALGEPIAPARATARFRVALKELEGSVLAIENRRVRFSNPGVRDYLQIAVMADQMLMPIVDELTRFDEIREAWRVFQSPGAQHEITENDAEAWVRAAKRAAEDDSVGTIPLLEFFLDLHVTLGKDELVEMVLKLAENLEGLECSDSELRALGAFLENLSLQLLPITALSKMQYLTTHALAANIVANAWAMSIDELDAFDRILHGFGTDDALATSSVHDAIDEYLTQFGSELENFTSHDELETYERDLHNLIKRRGYQRQSPDPTIEKHRERINEREEEEDSGYEPTQPIAVSNDNSSEAIKSMFRNVDWGAAGRS